MDMFITIPGFGAVEGPSALKSKGITDLASFLSALYNVFLFFAAFLAFFWLVWGSIQYIMAKGSKDELAKAKSKIWWALIGLAVVIMAFTLAQFATEVFPPRWKDAIPF